MTYRFTPTSPAVMMIFRSFIRKAMVKTMFRAVQERDPVFDGRSAGFREDKEEDKGEELGSGWADGSTVPRTRLGDAIESAAGACVLWCTVAMGCLIGGRPKSSVSSASILSKCSLLSGVVVAVVVRFDE